MKSLAKKFKRFLNDESGAEFLEVAAIIIGAVVIVAVIVLVYSSIKGKVEQAKTSVDGMEFPQ